MQHEIVSVTGRKFPASQILKGSSVRSSLLGLIKKDYPDFNNDSNISIDELNEYRNRYIDGMMLEEYGDLSQLEKEVISRLKDREFIARNVEEDIHKKRTVGQRISDLVAQFGGSWVFIIMFFVFILIWMMINIILLEQKAFDPYPFILLNLVLSCIAAIQAPVIMMSQNRKEERDRERSINDYKVNLKAEMEIKLLHEKIDHVISHQNQRLLEILQIHNDYLDDITKKLNSKSEK